MVSENTKRMMKVTFILVLTMMTIMFLYSPYYHSTITNFAVRDLNELEIIKQGQWNKVYGDYIDGNALFSEVSGSSLYTEFEGYVVSLIVKVGPSGGVIRSYLDNKLTMYDLYAEHEMLIKVDLGNNLTHGVHELRIQVANSRNNLSNGNNVIINKIIIDEPTVPMDYVSKEFTSFEQFNSLLDNVGNSINTNLNQNLLWLGDKMNKSKQSIVPMSITEELDNSVVKVFREVPLYFVMLLFVIALVGSSGYYISTRYELSFIQLLRNLFTYIILPFELVYLKLTNFKLNLFNKKTLKKNKKVKNKIKVEKLNFESHIFCSTLGVKAVFQKVISCLKLFVWALITGVKVIYIRVVCSFVYVGNSFVKLLIKLKGLVNYLFGYMQKSLIIKQTLINKFKSIKIKVSLWDNTIKQQVSSEILLKSKELNKLKIIVKEKSVDLEKSIGYLNKVISNDINKNIKLQRVKPKIVIPEVKSKFDINKKLKSVRNNVVTKDNFWKNYMAEIDNRINQIDEGIKMQKVRPNLDVSQSERSNLNWNRKFTKVEKEINQNLALLDADLERINAQIGSKTEEVELPKSLFQRFKERLF